MTGDGTTRCNAVHPDFPAVVCRINQGDHREQTHRCETPLGTVEWPIQAAPPTPPVRSLKARDTCDCGTRLKNGRCDTCREFIWRVR